MFIQGLWEFVLDYVEDTQNSAAAENGCADFLCADLRAPSARCRTAGCCFCAASCRRSSAYIRRLKVRIAPSYGLAHHLKTPPYATPEELSWLKYALLRTDSMSAKSCAVMTLKHGLLAAGFSSTRRPPSGRAATTCTAASTTTSRWRGWRPSGDLTSRTSRRASRPAAWFTRSAGAMRRSGDTRRFRRCRPSIGSMSTPSPCHWPQCRAVPSNLPAMTHSRQTNQGSKPA